MARCYSYIRFSTPEQALGDSLRRQTEMSEQYAAENGLIIDKSLNLFDAGLSGYTGENRKKGALAVFLKAVESKIVPPGSFLLVESLDRLSRDTISEQMTLFMQLVNSDITVVTLKDKQVYSKATIDSDISRLMLSLVIMMRSHDESAMKSHRLREAWGNKRKNIGSKKLTAQCPRWLKLNPDRTAFTEIPERVALLRRIYQMSLDGMGLKSIARILNEEKVPQWTAKGIGWQISYVGRLLISRAVLGEHQPQQLQDGKFVTVGDPVPDYYPAVIDLATWQRAQARRKTATPGRPGAGLSNLFSGIAFDGYTGMPMRHNSSGKNRRAPNGYDYLVSDYGRMVRKAKAIRWRYAWFEKWFLDFITRLNWTDVANEPTPEAEMALQKQLAEQQAKVEGIDKSLERLVKLASTVDAPPKTILDQIWKLENERQEADRELGRLETEVENAATRRNALHETGLQIRDLAAAGDLPTRLRLREEIRRRISRIDLFPKGVPSTKQISEDFPVPIREDQPAFKIVFTNGAIRWAYCDSRKPGGDASIMDENPPAAEMPELQLREQPETYYAQPVNSKSRKKQSKQRKLILLPAPSIRKPEPRAKAR